MRTPKKASWLVMKIMDEKKWLEGSGTIQAKLQPYSGAQGFNIRIGYLGMLPQYSKVDWRKLVLVQGQLPRQRIILCLALHNRLNTMDKILK